jgi:hypothetical protein
MDWTVGTSLFSSVTGETAVEIRPEPPSLTAASAGE